MMKLLFTLFILKHLTQIKIFKLYDDILHSIHFNKLLQGFVQVMFLPLTRLGKFFVLISFILFHLSSLLVQI